MAKIPTLKRRSLGQEVTIVLRQMVQRGELAPGERLVEERLAEQLGLSRTPVREALHRLEQEGLLLKRPRGGYEVRNLTIEEVEEVAGVRAVLAAYAAERAAGRISPEELILLEQNIKDFGQAIEANDEDTLLDLNSDFHSRILQASASPLLNRLLGELHGEVERVSRAAASNMPAGIWSLEDHQALFEALKNRDGAKAAQIAKRHVRHGADHLITQLAARGQEIVED
jgi:DNA-binding GntR family transcriptional regulator